MKTLLTVQDLEVQRNSAFTLAIPKLRADAGSVLCIAGPNGSGKSTFIECLAGLLKSTKGIITLNGMPLTNDLRSVKAILGYVPDDENWFIKELCAREYLDLLASVYKDAGVTSDIAKNRATLSAKLRFTAFDLPLQQLSHGNKKKVQIIAALMHDPQIIILDEIRNGLDPLAIITTEVIIRDQARRGSCVIAATHDLWWAERIASDILLLIDGKPAIQQSTKDILKQYGNLESLFMQLVNKV